MAASEEAVTKCKKSLQLQINPSSSQQLNESVTAHTDNETNPANASPEPSATYYSTWNCDGYHYDAISSHSQSLSSKSISNSISFSYEESQIGQFYMKQEAAKKSKKYNMQPVVLSVETPAEDNEVKHYDDNKTMNRILINYRQQESASKDPRRGIRRADTFQVVEQQKQAPLQTRIAQWRREYETEDQTPNMQHFNSDPGKNQRSKDKHAIRNHMMNGSMSGQFPRERSSSFDLSKLQSSQKMTDDELLWGYMNPQLSSSVSGLDKEIDSGSDDDQDGEEKEDSFEPEQTQIAQKQDKLVIQRTMQLLMVSSGDSKGVFQSLWNICMSLKKDPEYHISFNDKLLKHDHVEEFLGLLGFLKDKLSSRWSCFALTRASISLIDTAILECHKCRQIIQQRGTTINLVNECKKKSKSSEITPTTTHSTNSTIFACTPPPDASGSNIYSIDQDEKDSADSVQLYELIWGITHNNNDDPGAKDVLLLCYPLVTNAKYILYCLQARFFKDDHDETLTFDTQISPSIEFGKNKTKYDKILSSFEVQANVIAFIRHWMIRFWDKDWDSNPNLMSFCELFIKRMRKAYQSEEKQQHYESLEASFQGLRLVEMLEKTIKTQKSHRQMRLSKILGDESENHGLLLFNNDGNGSKTRNKNRSSVFSLSFSGKKMNKGPKHFMDINYVIIAESITLLQFHLFKKIHPRECLKQAWKNKKRKYKDAPNITQYIDAFNQMTKWIQSTILLVKDVKARGRTIKKWIKVEEELLKLRNFQTLVSVFGGLSSVAIHRLKDAWSYVPKKHITQHQEIKVIMKSNRNWKNLRTLQLQTHPPMLPYFGMFAQDMIVIEETTNNRKNDGSIDWDALCRGQAAIDKYLIYQKTPYKNLNTHLSIQRWMNRELRISAKLDDEYIYQISANVVLNDKRELGKDNNTNISKQRNSSRSTKNI